MDSLCLLYSRNSMKTRKINIMAYEPIIEIGEMSRTDFASFVNNIYTEFSNNLNNWDVLWKKLRTEKMFILYIVFYAFLYSKYIFWVNLLIRGGESKRTKICEKFDESSFHSFCLRAIWIYLLLPEYSKNLIRKIVLHC